MMLPLILMLTFVQPASDTAVTATHTLTMDQAVATARSNHPSLRVARARSAGASARVDQARAPLRPTLGASARYSASTGSPFDSNLTGRTSYGAGLSGGILLYDFGRTSAQYEAAKVSAEAQRYDETSAEQDVVLDVRVAFLSARAAKDLLVITQERLATEDRHFKQVQAFVDLGSRPPIDLAKSTTLVANARAAVTRAQSDYDIAKARLSAAMGVTGTGDYDIAETSLTPVGGENGTTSALYDEAVAARPELAAARADIKASKLSLGATEKGNHPAFRFGTDVSVGGSDLDRPSWSASAGVSVSFDLFDGGANAARVRADRANVRALEAQQEVLTQQTWLTIEQSRLAVVSAKAELVAAGEAHQAAKQLVLLAEGRYAQGAGNAVELADAQFELTSAASRVVQAKLKLDVARAQLLRAVGRGTWG